METRTFAGGVILGVLAGLGIGITGATLAANESHPKPMYCHSATEDSTITDCDYHHGTWYPRADTTWPTSYPTMHCTTSADGSYCWRAAPPGGPTPTPSPNDEERGCAPWDKPYCPPADYQTPTRNGGTP